MFGCLFGHNWDGCSCTRCGEQRDEGHAFTQLADRCVERCDRCRMERSIAHEWDGCRCRRCQSQRDEGHRWSNNRCEICGRADYSPAMEPFLRREGFRYSKEAEEQKAKALATVLSCGVDGEEFLVDFLVKDVTLIDNRFLLKSYGEFAHGEWLKKTTIVRALGEAKGSYVPEKLATYLMCVGAENQFAVFFQPALVETLGRLKAYEALEKYVDSGQRVPAVQLALDILRLRDAGTADHPMNAWDDGGYTPLQRAVAEKDRAAAQRVLDAGADIDVVRPRGDDSVGQTALHMAVLEKDAEMVGLLLSRGADPDIQDMGGSSALQRAGAMGLSRIAALLVEGGADVNIKTLSGKTPLAWARQNGHKDVAAYLAEHGGT